MKRSTTQHESDVLCGLSESASAATDAHATKKCEEEDTELHPDVEQYIVELVLSSHMYVSRLALIGLTGGAIIAATRRSVSEARKSRSHSTRPQ